MMRVHYSMEVCMGKGSSGLRSYLEERGFDIYRKTRISNRLEQVHGIRLDEDDKIDDDATFLAIWESDNPHEEESSIRRKVTSHPSVTKFKTDFAKKEYQDATTPEYFG